MLKIKINIKAINTKIVFLYATLRKSGEVFLVFKVDNTCQNIEK